MKIKIPWAEDEIELDLPENWEVQFLKNKETPPVITDLETYVTKKLDNPIESPALSKKLNIIKEKDGNIMIVIDDRTRPTPVSDIMPIIVKYLEDHDFPLEKCELIVGLGIHRLMEPEEIEKRVTSEVYNKIKCYNHLVDDESTLKEMGTISDDIPVVINKNVAEADLVISISTIESHGQAGFGGGLKNIIPGVAGRATINPVHDMKYLSKTRMGEPGSLKKDNQMRQLIDECALKGTKDVFLINTVLNVNKPIEIITGDPLSAHKRGVDMIRGLFGHKLEDLADIVITDSHPLDADFRAGSKSISNSLNACRKGGVVISIMRALEGWGDVTVPDISKLKGWILRNFPLGFVGKAISKAAGSPDQSGGTFDMVKLCRFMNPHLYAPSITDNEPLLNLGFKMFPDKDRLIQSVQDHFTKKKGPDAKLKCVVMPFGAITFPLPPEN